MLEFLPKEVREGLEMARMRDQKRRSRLRAFEFSHPNPQRQRHWMNAARIDAGRIDEARRDGYERPQELRDAWGDPEWKSCT